MLSGPAGPGLLVGWQDPVIPERQRLTFNALLKAMHEGSPREDFVGVADAVRATGLTDPLIVEVGCSSGWNAEVLSHLLQRPVRYMGIDYSHAMVALGRRYYPALPFAAGDATALPLKNSSCDILLSGGVLMHLAGYHQAILESRRVTRCWCIFHTVPVVQRAATKMFSKPAYGARVFEVVFNEADLVRLFEESRLELVTTFDGVAHEYLSALVEEPVGSKTYLCRVA